MAQMERLLWADPPHGSNVGHVGRVEQGLLVHQCRPVDQPSDHGHVSPRVRRVVEDVVELGPAVHQVVEHLLACLAEVFGHPVQDLAVAHLVLNLGRQGQLPLQGGGARDPFPFGQGAHHLGIGVHLDELQGRLPVFVGHPFAGLDPLAGIDARLEGLRLLLVRHLERDLPGTSGFNATRLPIGATLRRSA